MVGRRADDGMMSEKRFFLIAAGLGMLEESLLSNKKGKRKKKEGFTGE